MKLQKQEAQDQVQIYAVDTYEVPPGVQADVPVSWRLTTDLRALVMLNVSADVQAATGPRARYLRAYRKMRGVSNC